VQGLPTLLAVLVGLLAVGTIVNTLVTSVRRRRRDLATLATLGLRRFQVAATVAWQATTYAVLGLLIGVPLGVVAGRLVWDGVMASIGSDLGVDIPVLALLALAALVLLAANAAALVPARAAARLRPGRVLRSE
jgi:putative ABC transport system permease protein